MPLLENLKKRLAELIKKQRAVKPPVFPLTRKQFFRPIMEGIARRAPVIPTPKEVVRPMARRAIEPVGRKAVELGARAGRLPELPELARRVADPTQMGKTMGMVLGKEKEEELKKTTAYYFPSELAKNITALITDIHIKIPIKMGLGIAEAGRTIIGGKRIPKEPVKVPLIGKISSYERDVYEAIKKGEKPWLAAAKAGLNTIIDGAIVAGMAKGALKEPLKKLKMSPDAARKVLNIKKGEAVKDAYYRLSRRYHPDRGGDPKIFKQINDAYQTLTGQRPAMVKLQDFADTMLRDIGKMSVPAKMPAAPEGLLALPGKAPKVKAPEIPFWRKPLPIKEPRVKVPTGGLTVEEVPPKKAIVPKELEPTKLFHHTDVKVGDVLKAGKPSVKNYFGEGVYLGSQKGVYPGKFVKEVQIPKGLKTLDLTKKGADDKFLNQVSKIAKVPIEKTGMGVYEDLRLMTSKSSDDIIRKAVDKITKGYEAIKSPLEYKGQFEMVVKKPFLATKEVKEVKPEITPPIKPLIKPPIKPTPSPAEMPQFKEKPVRDPIAELNELLTKAKPLRGKLERTYRVERAKRIANVERFIEKNIDEVGGEEGYAKILSKLKGELISPKAKIRFEPIKKKLTEDQLKSLYIRTWKHPYLDNWEKISAADGLTNLLGGEIPQPKQLVLLEEVYGTDLIKTILSKRALGLKTKDFIVEVMNLPRALLATADMSAFLRQGLIPVIAHPKISAKAVAKTFQFAFSPKSFEQYFKNLPKDPLYSLMRKSKLSITDPFKAGMVGREEAFISRLLQKIPVVKIPITFAERSYVGFLNKVRVDLFKTWADEFLSKGLSPVKDIDYFKAMANVVNTFTGRGTLGKLDRITPELNTIFFSPRLISARFNALNPVWYSQMPKAIRKKAIGDFAKFVVAGLTTLALIKLWRGDEVSVETDPRSSDFGKMRIGNTRFDIWGGFQQWARVFAQVITGERKSTSTGEIVSLTKDEYPFTTRKEVLLRFIEGKLAPVPALINELMAGGKTFTGEDITFKTTAREKFIPMYIQDIAEAYADGGIGRAVGAGIPAFFGVGVQTWKAKGKMKTPEGLPPLPGLGTPSQGLPALPGLEKGGGGGLPPLPGL